MAFFDNTREPIGIGGKIMVSMMNFGHRALAEWGFRFLELKTSAKILDCGCGGGANIRKLLNKHPQGSVTGIDYSPVSVEKSRRLNAKAIEEGRCRVFEGSVAELPFSEAQFDAATAFETVYFWPNLPHCFQEVWRVLKPSGIFLICNEANGEVAKDNKWTEIIAGMTIYNDIELRVALEQAGFHDIRIHKNQKGWLCVTGQK